MTNPKIRVLSGLLCLPLLACAADNDDASTGTSTTNTPDASTTTTTGSPGSDTGPATGSDTGSSGATTTSGSTGDDTTGAVDTTGADTSTGTTGDGTTGTGTTGDDTSTGGPAGLSWALDVYPVVIANNCGCHATDGAGGLTMTDATDSYAILVGVNAWYSDLKRVEPGEPENSYLLHKLNGTQDKVNGHGAQMPFGGAPLAKEKIDLVAQWISEDAQP